MHKHKVVLRNRQDFLKAIRDPKFSDKVNRGLVNYHELDILSNETKGKLRKFWFKNRELNHTFPKVINQSSVHFCVEDFLRGDISIKLVIVEKVIRKYYAVLRNRLVQGEYSEDTRCYIHLLNYFQDVLEPTRNELIMLELQKPEYYKVIMDFVEGKHE